MTVRMRQFRREPLSVWSTVLAIAVSVGVACVGCGGSSQSGTMEVYSPDVQDTSKGDNMVRPTDAEEPDIADASRGLPCESSKECPGLLLCDPETGQCVDCVGPEDCAENQSCLPDHTCGQFQPCGSDKDCKSFGQVCDKQEGVCVDCNSSKDCQSSDYCSGGVCLADVCTADVAECSGATVVVCSEDGGKLLLLAECSGEQKCAEGACVNLFCVPSAAWCDGQVYKVCNADGAALVVEDDCAQLGLKCSETGCTQDVCPPQCGGKECGDDGCGSVCGQCEPGQECSNVGLCVAPNGLVWVPIPAGTFWMGCSPGDEHCHQGEKPQHPVTLSAFDILETEVTEGQYEALVGTNPSCEIVGDGGPDSPVDCVTWFDAKVFCENVGGRLCTEAEWEYAARGGTAWAYYCGPDVSCLAGIAWYYDNCPDNQKRDVKGKAPNAFGLYDMLGNVDEWTSDWYKTNYYEVSPTENPQGPSGSADQYPQGRVSRGGCFQCDASGTRVSFRGAGIPDKGSPIVGIRCCRPK